MFLMRADPLRGQVRGGWSLEIESFWVLMCHRADRGVPFGARKTRDFQPQANTNSSCAGILEQSMGAMNRVGIWWPYQPPVLEI
jgi:hypothetical protein